MFFLYMVYSIRPVITNNISLQCCVISVQIVLLMVMWWRYLQGNRLAIHRLWVPVSAGYHCIVALVKLLTLVCLCHQAVSFSTSQRGDLFGWESNRGPGGK